MELLRIRMANRSSKDTKCKDAVNVGVCLSNNENIWGSSHSATSSEQTRMSHADTKSTQGFIFKPPGVDSWEYVSPLNTLSGNGGNSLGHHGSQPNLILALNRREGGETRIAFSSFP